VGLKEVNFSGCAGVTDKAVMALAASCSELQSVVFGDKETIRNGVTDKGVDGTRKYWCLGLKKKGGSFATLVT
jgi:hypothetical protein